MTFLEMAQNPGSLTLDERIQVRERLELNIRQNRSVEKTLELLLLLETAEQRRPTDRALHNTGSLSWEKHTSAASRFRGFAGEEHVATVRRRAHHSSQDKNVFSVWFGDQEVASEIHHFPDAIRVGEAAWSHRAGQGASK